MDAYDAPVLAALADWLEQSPEGSFPHAGHPLEALATRRRSGGSERSFLVSALRLPGQLDDVFELPVPDAPGLVSIGAKIAAAPGGISGSARGANGIGLDAGEAFLRCMGEAFEARVMRSPGGTNELRVITAEREGLSPRPPTADEKSRYHSWMDAIRERPLSEGCAVHASFDEAVTAGLSELIERDAAVRWWVFGGPVNSVDAEQVLSPGEFARLENAAAPLLASTTFLRLPTAWPISVFAAALIGADGLAHAVGYAARPTTEGAARDAFLEMVQVHLGVWLAWLQVQRNPEVVPSKSAGRFLKGFPLPQTDDRPVLDSAHAPRQDLIAALCDRGSAVFVGLLDGTPAGVHAVRVVIPGLYPSSVRASDADGEADRRITARNGSWSRLPLL